MESISSSVRWNHRIYIVGGGSYDGMSRDKMFYWSLGGLCARKGSLFCLVTLEVSHSAAPPLKTHLPPSFPAGDQTTIVEVIARRRMSQKNHGGGTGS